MQKKPFYLLNVEGSIKRKTDSIRVSLVFLSTSVSSLSKITISQGVYDIFFDKI
ncbi:uncharacterized protein METZ01_LOCUS305245, partial [marine metagenome]